MSNMLQAFVLFIGTAYVLGQSRTASFTDSLTGASLPNEQDYSPLQHFKKLKLCRDDKYQELPGYKAKLECSVAQVEGAAVSDPSCISCLKETSLSTSEKLWRKYLHPASRQSRLQMFKKHFFPHEISKESNSCGKPIVIVAASDESLPSLISWWFHAQQNGIGRDRLVVYSYGIGVTRWAGHNELYTMQPALYSVGDSFTGNNAAAKYALFPLFLDLLSIGKTVIYSDLDVTWTDTLEQKLSTAISDLDLIGQASYTADGSKLSPSILSLRPTPQTVSFVQSMLSTAPLFIERFTSSGDQIFWDQLLRNELYSSLKWETIPSPMILRHDKKDAVLLNATRATDTEDTKLGRGIGSGCAESVNSRFDSCLFSDFSTAMKST